MKSTYVFYHEDDHFVTLHAVVDSHSLEAFIEKWKMEAEAKHEEKVMGMGFFKKENITHLMLRSTTSDGHVHLTVHTQAVQPLTHLTPTVNSVSEWFEGISYGPITVY